MLPTGTFDNFVKLSAVKVKLSCIVFGKVIYIMILLAEYVSDRPMVNSVYFSVRGESREN